MIGAGVVIGEDCDLVARVTVYPGTTMGRPGDCEGRRGAGQATALALCRDPATGRYHKFPQIGRLEIGNDVEIGANTTVDRGALDATVIGDGVKLDNLVQVGHNVRIGRNVVVASQTGISGSTVIEDGVILGGQVGIADHVASSRGDPGRTEWDSEQESGAGKRRGLLGNSGAADWGISEGAGDTGAAGEEEITEGRAASPVIVPGDSELSRCLHRRWTTSDEVGGCGSGRSRGSKHLCGARCRGAYRSRDFATSYRRILGGPWINSGICFMNS